MEFETAKRFIADELVPLIHQVMGVKAVYTRTDEVNRMTKQRGVRIRVVLDQRNFGSTSGAVFAIYTAIMHIDSAPVPRESTCLEIEICRNGQDFDAETSGVGWNLALAEA
jgi:hypothetical protein